MVKSLLSKIIHLPKKYLALIALLVIGIPYFIISSSASSDNTFQTEKATKRDIRSEVSASGILSGKDNASLKFKSSGKLAYLNVKPGDSVEAGQVNAGLDTQDLNIALQQAQNNYRDKQAAAEKVEDDVKNHSSDETFSQKQTRTSAQAARDSAFDSVKAAQRAFQDAVIVSPLSGTVVGQSEIVAGQNVSVTDVIATIVDFSGTEFLADVDEMDIGKVSIGQRVEVSLNSYPDKLFAGNISEIVPQTKTSSTGAITVTVKIPLSDSSIKPIYGLNGSANIILASAPNVLAIPISSLVNDSVLVKNGGRYEVKKVNIGLKTDSDVEITGGLNEGEDVVTDPPQDISSFSSNTSGGFFSRIFNRNGGR